jgi:hypothetical protein
MFPAIPETIPEDHDVWSILTGDLVSDLLQELRPNSSPALRRLYNIIVQHPSNPTGERTCVRNGIDVPLKARKRKGTEGTEDGRKSKKGRSWETDGVPPSPTPAASAMISKLGSAISRERLPHLVRLVRALIERKTHLESVDKDDFSFEATLKMCRISDTNRALRDFYNMIGYIRLAFLLDR